MSTAIVHGTSLFQSLLNEVVVRSSEVVGSRSGAAVQDLVLSLELATFFCLWLRERSRVNSLSRPLFIVYAINLLAAASWCGLGVYIHLFEPLPTERTATWLAFLVLGAATPLLFPVVSSVAFAKQAPTPSNYPAPYVVSGLSSVAYIVFVATGADLSLGGLMPNELWLTPWHKADGRSLSGVPHGISFDLLSSCPCYRGDSMFIMSTVFLIGVSISLVMLTRATRDCKEAFRPIARRLSCGLVIEIVNCVSLLYIQVVFKIGSERAFDLFHAIQFLVMAAAFFDLRSVLRLQCEKIA